MGSDSITTELLRIEEAGLYRKLRLVESDQGPTLLLDGREVINFSSNNYLGLANHPSLCKAAKEAIDRYGCGSGASRLISGNMTLHEELETQDRRAKGHRSSAGFQLRLSGEHGAPFHFSRRRGCDSERCAQSRKYHRRLPPIARKDLLYMGIAIWMSLSED